MAKTKSQFGRPNYQVIWPRGKFTFLDLQLANGVNPKTNKGKHCTTLTLRNHIKRELKKRNNSKIMIVKGVFGEPNGKSGLGKKPFVYTRRPLDHTKAPVKKTTAQSPVINTTEEYEAQKAALLGTPETTIDISSTTVPAETHEETTAQVPSESHEEVPSESIAN